MLCGYAERAYFTTDACQHCAARDEHKRLTRIAQRTRALLTRRDRYRRAYRP